MNIETITALKELLPLAQTLPGVAILIFIVYIWSKHYKPEKGERQTCNVHNVLTQKFNDIKESLSTMAETQKELKSMFQLTADKIASLEKKVYGLQIISKLPVKVDDDTKG